MRTLEYDYDLILMDHLMPEMDGIECLHAIRSQAGGLCKDTKVIVLTANAESENRSLYSKEGFDGYLIKPITGEILEAEVLKNLPRHLVITNRNDADADEIETYETRRRVRSRIPVLMTTESVCDLPESYITDKNLAVIPYHVKTADGDFLDSVEAESRGILSYMADGRTDARSVEPSLSEYEEFFAENLLLANHVIHIAMSSKVGKGCANAKEAALTFDNVTVIDSMHLSSGMGLLVMEAVQLAATGDRADRIVKEIEEMRGRIHTSFIVLDTNYLANAGRLHPTANRIAKALMLRPSLRLKNGKMGIGRAYFGTEEHARKKYVSDALDVFSPIDKRTVFITHAGLTVEELREIRRDVEKKVIFSQVIFQKASSAITANCGMGAFGILFMTEK